MTAAIGDLDEPLMHLGVHIGKSAKVRRGQKFCRIYPIARSTFPFSQAAAHMTSTGNEVVLPGEGEKARMESHQRTIVLGDDRREVVVPELARHTTQGCESMDVAAHQSLETSDYA